MKNKLAYKEEFKKIFLECRPAIEEVEFDGAGLS
jgi:hypothetical protein